MANQIGSRLVFENAKSFIESQNYDVSQAVLTQSYVRSEVAIAANVTNYRLPIVINDGTSGANAFSTERRVQLQDVHVASSIFIGLAAPSSSTDAAFPVCSYPSLSAGFSAAQADALFTLYNSSLQITVNNQQILPNWDVLRHYYVPQTQGGVGITAQTVFPIDQFDGGDNGFYPVEPNILLNGAANIVCNLVLPAAISTVKADSRFVVIFRTILAQNVTSVR